MNARNEKIAFTVRNGADLMDKVFILYRSFFDMKGENYTVGGIQTYIRQLINVIKKNNKTPVIVQFADSNFHNKFMDIDVYGVDVKDINKTRKKSKALVNFVKGQFEKRDILLFATDDMFVPSFTERVITIQHGITWDRPLPSLKYYTLEVLKKYFNSYRRLKRMKPLKTLICVDYNFVNWYRTQVCNVDKDFFVIPNSTRIKKNEIISKDKGQIKVIFARRFTEYRGTRLFAKTIKKLLEKYDNTLVTFAGSGPDEEFLKKEFNGDSRVNFITYKSEDSLEIHEQYQIAVVPTLGSEGTSLSLLEAMASKCAVVTTNVGGLTNIILDNYNGLIVSPNEEQLYNAIEKLIIDENLREKMSENGFETVSQAFNIGLWEERWTKVLTNIK